MATGGRNMGRVGVITHRERHDGGFNIVHIKDAMDNSFATRETNVFVIGNEKPWISLPKGKGVKVRPYVRLILPAVTMLISHSFRLLRRGIVVVPTPLQATKGFKMDKNSIVTENGQQSLDCNSQSAIKLRI